MNRPSSPLAQALDDTMLLWLLLLVAAGLQIAAHWGIEVPLLARTTLWRLGHSAWALLGVAIATGCATVALAASRQHRHRAYFVAGLLAGLAVAYFVTFDPGTGAAFAATAAGLYRRLGRERVA